MVDPAGNRKFLRLKTSVGEFINGFSSGLRDRIGDILASELAEAELDEPPKGFGIYREIRPEAVIDYVVYRDSAGALIRRRFSEWDGLRREIASGLKASTGNRHLK